MRSLLLLFCCVTFAEDLNRERVKEECEFGDGGACFAYGIHVLGKVPTLSDLKYASMWFHKSCKLKDQAGCHEAGNIAIVTKDLRAASEWFELGCASKPTRKINLNCDPAKWVRECKAGDAISCATIEKLPSPRLREAEKRK